MEEKNNFLGAIDYSQLATMDTKSEEEKRLDYEEEQRKKKSVYFRGHIKTGRTGTDYF